MTAPATPAPVLLRNLDPALWRRVKVEAIRHDTSAGALLSRIIAEWLAAHQPCPEIDE